MAVVATAACFASCNKTCSCDVYTGGDPDNVEVKLDDLKTTYATYAGDTEIKKCSDLDNVTTLDGAKFGVVCK